MDIQSNLDNLIFANLLFVTIVCWASLVFPKFKFLSKLGFYGNCCASSCLFILLGSRWLISGYFPLSNLYESLMFLAWGITSLGVIIEDRSKVSIIGSIVHQYPCLLLGLQVYRYLRQCNRLLP